MHKALEYYLRDFKPNDKQGTKQCFIKGLRDGDSPLRKLEAPDINNMKQVYLKITKDISKVSRKILAIEQRYRYLHDDYGQVDGVIDALIEQQDGTVVLKEWKTQGAVSSEIQRQYELQARVGALAMLGQNLPAHKIEIVPIGNPKKTISISCDNAFINETKDMLKQVFKDIQNRNYKARRGTHCKVCQLSSQCPA